MNAVRTYLYMVLLCLALETVTGVPCPAQEKSAVGPDVVGHSCSAEYEQRLTSHFFVSLDTDGDEMACVRFPQTIRCRQAGEIPPCNIFVGKALELLYSVKDFRTKDGFLSANDMSNFLKSAPEWIHIGNADDQAVLERAQERANGCHPTIAVYRNMSTGRHGHVSIILPGELRPSWTWGLMVPNSASSFLNRLWESYSGNKLSYAFAAGEIKDVRIYYRDMARPPPKRRTGYNVLSR